MNPPVEKVYEAWSALADGRVHLIDDNKAAVESSDGSKSYTILYNSDTGTYASNDNATFWRGYPGYPVLAVLMSRHILPSPDPEYLKQWAHINWKALNTAHKRDYAAAVGQVEAERAIDPVEAASKAQFVMDALSKLDIKVKRLRSGEA